MRNSGAAAKLPRLCMINSMAGYGRISTTVALPVISTMQVQVCPVPTSVLSNHLAFPACYKQDFTPHMGNYIETWKTLGVTFDGLYCGYLGSVAQMEVVYQFLDDFHPAVFLLDPVMADNGRVYSTITPEHIEKMKILASRADILTPNLTEACLLTDTPYVEEPWSDEALKELLCKLSALCPGRIVITGLHRDHLLVNAIWENEQFSTYSVPVAGKSRSGTGDLFASIVSADILRGADLFSAVKKAANFIALCIRGAEELNIPAKEGVPFELYLHCLQ